MAEYIDRIAIVQKIKNRYMPRLGVNPYNVNLYDAGVNSGLDLALGLIESAISEDVLPVRHAHWIRYGKADMSGNYNYECSYCGKGDVHHPDIVVSYCWSCGAIMDGDDEEIKPPIIPAEEGKR